MGGQPPAQEDLVVGEGALGVNDRSLRHCGKRKWVSQGLATGLAWRKGQAGKRKQREPGGECR